MTLAESWHFGHFVVCLPFANRNTESDQIPGSGGLSLDNFAVVESKGRETQGGALDWVLGQISLL